MTKRPKAPAPASLHHRRLKGSHLVLAEYLIHLQRLTNELHGEGRWVTAFRHQSPLRNQFSLPAPRQSKRNSRILRVRKRPSCLRRSLRCHAPVASASHAHDLAACKRRPVLAPPIAGHRRGIHPGDRDLAVPIAWDGLGNRSSCTKN
jgi:hypothetical protein